MKIAEKKLTALIRLLDEKQKNIVIVSHRNPDGDSIGASCALYNYLLKKEHKPNIIVPNQYPRFLSWMKNAESVIVYDKSPDKCKNLLETADILFAVDFNDLSRIKEFGQFIDLEKTFKILIDHHPEPGDFANLTLSDTSVSSASELVYLFLKMIDGKFIDKDIAECIYTGIMTDTGVFSFNSSSKQTFNVVAELIDYGINKDRIYDSVYNNFSFERMKLLGHCLQDNLEVIPEYNAAFIRLSIPDMKRFNFQVGDSEGFVNIPLSIKGIKFSALFTEHKEFVKISLRSKGKIDVNKIARENYSGGGHINAAGGESKLNLKDTIKNFRNLLPKYKDELLND